MEYPKPHNTRIHEERSKKQKKSFTGYIFMGSGYRHFDYQKNNINYYIAKVKCKVNGVYSGNPNRDNYSMSCVSLEIEKRRLIGGMTKASYDIFKSKDDLIKHFQKYFDATYLPTIKDRLMREISHSKQKINYYNDKLNRDRSIYSSLFIDTQDAQKDTETN